MNTDAVCDLIKHIEGIDATMLSQYGATVKKVRLLPLPHQCPHLTASESKRPLSAAG